MRGIATETIRPGDLVLCRNNKVSPASALLANGRARPLPKIYGDLPYRAGYIVPVEPLADLGGRCLKAIANGPLMDAGRLYLPAGKLSEADYRARQAQILAPERD